MRSAIFLSNYGVVYPWSNGNNTILLIYVDKQWKTRMIHELIRVIKPSNRHEQSETLLDRNRIKKKMIQILKILFFL